LPDSIQMLGLELNPVSR